MDGRECERGGDGDVGAGGVVVVDVLNIQPAQTTSSNGAMVRGEMQLHKKQERLTSLFDRVLPYLFRSSTNCFAAFAKAMITLNG